MSSTLSCLVVVTFELVQAFDLASQQQLITDLLELHHLAILGFIPG